MNCSRCGQQLMADAPTCPSCGAQANPKMQHAGSPPNDPAWPPEPKPSQTAQTQLQITCKEVPLLFGNYTVWLDGTQVVETDFSQDLNLTIPTTPGTHLVQTKIKVGGLGWLVRQKDYQVNLQPGIRYLAVLKYSRFWGQFDKRLQIEPLGPSGPTL